MRTQVRIRWVLSMFLTFAALVAAAQVIRPTASEMMAKLSSPEPLQRASAFVGLEKIGALSGNGAPETLLNLLDRENRLIEATLRESASQSGVSVKYGEEYSEYYAMLLRACWERCDRKNARTPTVLVNSSYSPSSDFAQQLARDHGEAILPALFQKARSDIVGFRAEGITMLGILKLANPTLAAAESASIRSAVITATRDASMPVRQGAVETLGKIGTTADIGLLTDIAKRDDAQNDYRGKTRYPVREQAEKAIESIRQRRQ